MHIVSKEIRQTHITEMRVSAKEWDPNRAGSLVWREHMAKLLNQHAKKIAPKCNPSQFYHSMLEFSRNLGFGCVEAVIKVTEQVYDVRLLFTEEERRQQRAA